MAQDWHGLSGSIRGLGTDMGWSGSLVGFWGRGERSQGNTSLLHMRGTVVGIHIIDVMICFIYTAQVTHQ